MSSLLRSRIVPSLSSCASRATSIPQLTSALSSLRVAASPSVSVSSFSSSPSPLLLSRSFTSSMVARVSVSDLPPNLVVADPSVLVAVPEPELKIEDFQFPLLSVPETVEVKKLLDTSALASPAKLERTMFEVPIRKDIVLNLVRYIRNARRQPKRTKRISDLRGSNKKPRPQKGSGTGQVGHRRNSAWRGGQKAHGPVLRDYSISLNKKVRALGMMMTVVAKYREGNLHVFENFELASHRTKELKNALEAHGLADSLAVFVDTELPDNFMLACSNLPKADPLELRYLDAYEVLKKDKVVITAEAFKALQDKLVFTYTQSGKKKNLQRRADEYMEIVRKGEEIKKSASASA